MLPHVRHLFAPSVAAEPGAIESGGASIAHERTSPSGVCGRGVAGHHVRWPRQGECGWCCTVGVNKWNHNKWETKWGNQVETQVETNDKFDLPEYLFNAVESPKREA